MRQQQNLTLNEAADLRKAKVLAKILHTAKVVQANISRIIEGEQTENADVQQQGFATNSVSPPTDESTCQSHYNLVPTTHAAALTGSFTYTPSFQTAMPSHFLPQYGFLTTNGQQPNAGIVQYFDNSLNECLSNNDVSNAAQEDEDDDDDIICLDDHPTDRGGECNNAVFVPPEDLSTPFTRSSSSALSVTDSFASPTDSYDCRPNDLNPQQQQQQQQQYNAVDVWSDQLILQLDEVEARQQQHQQNMGSSQLHDTIQQQQPDYQLLVGPQGFINEQHWQDGDGPPRLEPNPPTTSSLVVLHVEETDARLQQIDMEFLAAEPAQHGDGVTVEWNGLEDGLQMAERVNAAEEDDGDIEILGYSEINHASFADNNSDLTCEVGCTTPEVLPEAVTGEERGEENDVVDIVDGAFEQLRDAFREETEAEKGGDSDDSVQDVVVRFSVEMQLATRSKPFNRRVAENIGWKKKFARSLPNSREKSELISELTEVGINQEMLNTLKDAHPSLFLKTDEESESEWPGYSAMNDDKNEQELSEFDDIFERWKKTTFEQKDEKLNDKEKDGEKLNVREQVEDEEKLNDKEQEKDEGNEDEEEEEIRRGPVIKCPRMPKIKVILKRLTEKTIAGLIKKTTLQRIDSNSEENCLSCPTPKRICIESSSSSSSLDASTNAQRRQTLYNPSVRNECRHALSPKLAKNLFFNGSYRCVICDTEWSKTHYPVHMLVQHDHFVWENREVIDCLDAMSREEFAKIVWRCEGCQNADFDDIRKYFEHCDSDIHMAMVGQNKKKYSLKEWWRTNKKQEAV
uniref:C2H2-type domain-containing protein n=1 Tax=Globodera rostochiensis TaxID=31243 RepID=A0A914HZN1_GLORO